MTTSSQYPNISNEEFYMEKQICSVWGRHKIIYRQVVQNLSNNALLTHGLIVRAFSPLTIKEGG